MQVSCQWGLSAHQEGAISTVVFAGTFIGANAWGALADTYGRRAGFFATALFSFAFGIGSALAPNYSVSTPHAHGDAESTDTPDCAQPDLP